MNEDVKLPNGAPEEKKVNDYWKMRQIHIHKCKGTAWKR